MFEIRRLTPLPPLLTQLVQPPATLYIVGDSTALDLPLIAVVGTRKASSYGVRAATQFAGSLAKAGFGIVSGLAYGIDAAAHRAAVKAGGKTIAVLAGGLDSIYPAGNRALAESIVETGGCLLSEFPPNTPLQSFLFPRRNRIIAGLSLGTVVIEAGAKSGALITGRNAVEENRDVFVVPGAFDDSAFAGSHYLVQQGAKLVTHPRDVAEELLPGLLPFDPPRVSSELEKILRKAGGEGTFQEIISSSGWSIAEAWQKIEKARESGEIEEVSPQSFLWIKPTKVNELSGIPCQN